jgi:hypothetical protein
MKYKLQKLIRYSIYSTVQNIVSLLTIPLIMYLGRIFFVERVSLEKIVLLDYFTYTLKWLIIKCNSSFSDFFICITERCL